MFRKIIFMQTTALILFVFANYGFAQEPDFKKIFASIDAMQNFSSDFSAVHTIVSEEPGKEKDIMQAKIFRRDSGDKFTIVILKPDVKKGQGYIQLEDNLWFYDPESRKFVHTSIKENFQNSNAKNSDFRRSSYAEDYELETYTQGRLGAFDVYIADLKAKSNETTYPFLRVWISKPDYLLLKTESYSLTKRLMRSSYFPGYAKVGNNLIPDKMLFVDEIEKGKKTQITLKDISIAAIPDYVFTKSYLEQVNR
jgi:outer membrane lipoprotein-sorting protein